MATKLSLYNGALRLCKERKLASLSENREPRRLLDDAYGDGSTTGAVKACLEMGQWTFATRTVMLDYSPSVEPDFGYRRAFDQPDDLVRVTAVCEDEHFNAPLLRYADERRYWYADLDTIYVRYVSNDDEYGADLSLWPETFVKLVEAYLAQEIVGNLTGADSRRAEKAFKDAKLEARSLDAMNKPTVFMPAGSWSSARRGGRSRIDRPGYRLIG
jgi:hypothetical protein